MMAGIGFALRDLARSDSLASAGSSFLHASLVASGPWIFTVVAIGSICAFGARFIGPEELARFSTIITYNFCFSLVISGPLVIVVTRRLADMIYVGDVSNAPGMLIGALVILWSMQAIIAVPFYGFFADLSGSEKILGTIGFLLVGALWITSSFLSALRSFGVISVAFGFGMLAGLVLGGVWAMYFGVEGALAGFTVGMGVVFYTLLARILAEYPYPVCRPFEFVSSIRSYWALAVIGLLYNAGIWVDKWVMWLGPGHVVVGGAMPTHPTYDSAMFLACLSFVPAMALFVVMIETQFYEKYTDYFREVNVHGTLNHIENQHSRLIRVVTSGFQKLLIVQCIICYIGVFLAPYLISIFEGGLELIPVFRFGILGALFHTMMLFIIIMISYFDLRRILLRVVTLFFVLNLTCTAAVIPYGEAYWGYGYFVASLLSMLYAYIAGTSALARLPYLAFVGNNPTVRGSA